jgi:superfamily I DNA and/or RNA helicase
LEIPLKERENFRYRNHVEAAVIALIIDNLKHCGIQASSITVITPFYEQH